jgi:hypothetical protein
MPEGAVCRRRRVLAIDLSSRGFGFIVLEGPTVPVDWGTRQVNRVDKASSTIAKVRDLIHVYRPHVLVLEDTAAPRSRRCERVCSLLGDLALHARSLRVRVVVVSVISVRTLFSASGATTKHLIAGVVAERLPELAPLRPPLRKPWMREDERMSVFDAAAFAMAHYHGRRERNGSFQASGDRQERHG